MTRSTAINETPSSAKSHGGRGGQTGYRANFGELLFGMICSAAVAGILIHRFFLLWDSPKPIGVSTIAFYMLGGPIILLATGGAELALARGARAMFRAKQPDVNPKPDAGNSQGMSDNVNMVEGVEMPEEARQVAEAAVEAWRKKKQRPEQYHIDISISAPESTPTKSTSPPSDSGQTQGS